MWQLAIAASLAVAAVPAQADIYLFGGSFVPPKKTALRPLRVSINGNADRDLIVDSGWYDDRLGLHQPQNTNYIVFLGDQGELRNFFIIDLRRITLRQQIRSFQLVVYQPVDAPPNSGSFGLPATYTLYDVTTPLDVLTGATGDPFDDLGTGISYGSFTVGSGTGNSFLRFDLNAAGIAAANAARRGMFAIGGRITPIAGGGVPEPASWALMLSGFGAVGATLRRRRLLPSLRR